MEYIKKYLKEVEIIAQSIDLSKIEEMIQIILNLKINKG